MKPSELRTKSEKDLHNEEAAILKEIFSLRMQRGTGQTVQTHLFRKLRRDIARLKTILREKKGS